MPDPLRTNLSGIDLRNPVLLAAGTCGTLDEFAGVLDLSRVGGLVTKSITRQPREGNPSPRIIETRHGGMLNAIGLANPGIDAFEESYLPRAAGLPCAVIASVAGFSVEDYVTVAASFEDWMKGAPSASSGAADSTQHTTHNTQRAIDAIELNISCPNVRTGTEFCMSPPATREVVSAVRAVCKRAPLFVKLSPFASDITEIARAAIDAGASALTIGNTIHAMAIDVRTRRPRLANITGGLSGPAIHPVAVRLVHEVYTRVAKAANVPIIGAGGVLTWEDAAEFILAGATAVQMGTALFVDPRSPLKIVRGLETWVARQGCVSVSELVGSVQV